MNFEDDAFISYAHLDDVGLTERREGWVAELNRVLEARVGQLLGRKVHFYRDPKLQGNDFFSDTLVGQLQRVATLVSVVSPGYIKSEWTKKELSEFCKAAGHHVGIHDKARIFKVMKTPVPVEKQPPELQRLLGYEFFKIDPMTHKVH